MKKLWFPLMLLFILLNVSACNAEQECPVEVIVYPTDDGNSWAKVTSLVDDITITGVIANRGNIKNWSMEVFPKTLKFGEKVENFFLVGVDNFKEIGVQTDRGNWTFKF